MRNKGRKTFFCAILVSGDTMVLCPHCKGQLHKKENAYVCEKGHHFDVAKQGYTFLLLPSLKQSGDNKEMVQARTRFLQRDLYHPLREHLVEYVQEMPSNIVVDAGCGEGYYTNYLQNKLQNQVYAFDMSKEALKVAARHNKNVEYFVASIFQLPLAEESVDVVLNVFAPFAQEEFARVLKSGGYVIKVDPNKQHLYELKQALYEDVYENEVLKIESELFVLEKFEEITFTMTLDKQGIQDLFQMTPYYYKTKEEKKEALKQISQMECQVSFIVYFYKKR